MSRRYQKKMSPLKKVLTFISVVILVGFMFEAVPFIAFVWQDQYYQNSYRYEPPLDNISNVLVIYYSRNGHTESMAREIARKYQADIVKISSEIYPQDLNGLQKALLDANHKKMIVHVTPETVDLSHYQVIFLGSPIWAKRPAPPLWTFATRNDFQDKAVILFTTFSEEFDRAQIAQFKYLIESSGGRMIDHIYIKRGPFYDQITGDQLIINVKNLLAAKEDVWPSKIGAVRPKY